MIRALDLKFGGGKLLESEKVPDLLKDAAFYLGKKFEKTSDSDFKKWLVERQQKGYMEKDIQGLEKDIWQGDFGYLIPVYEKLPNYVSEVVDMLLKENGMLKQEKGRF